MNRSACTTALTAFAGVALFTTPAVAATAAGPGASAAPHVTYVSDGTTVAFTFNLKGTQHMGTGPENTSVPSPGILSFSADFGDGKRGTGGDAGPIGCTSKGATPFNQSVPFTYHYAKPGTYKVKVDFWYCGDAKNSHVTKTIDVTVKAKPFTGGAIKPTMTNVLLPSVKGRTLTYEYVAQGVQHYVSQNGGAPYPNKETTGYDIDFGAGSRHDAGNGTGGATCTNVGADPIYENHDTKTHTYAKAGTYTVKATTYYCGDGGEKKVTKSTVVKIGAAGQTIPTTTPKPTTGTAPLGPKVQTDMTHEGSSTGTAAFAGGALVVAAGGTFVARRRTR